MSRNLDHLEWQQMDKPTALIINYRGSLDPDALKEASRVTSARYPILRSKLIGSHDGYAFVEDPADMMPVATCRMDGTDHVRRVSNAWDVERSLAQVTLVQGESQGVVAMHTDHSIADGSAKLEMFRSLWNSYSRIAQGFDEPVIVNRKLPTSPSQTLRGSRGSKRPIEVAATTRHHPSDRHVMQQLYIRLSENETYGLVSAAHAHGMTVTSVLCGVILVTHRNAIQSTPGSISMTCKFPVNLRDHVEPRVGATQTTNFSGVHNSTVQVDYADDPISIGVECGRQLQAGVLSGEPLRTFSDWTAGVFTSSGHPGMHMPILTNLGRLTPFAAPPGLTLTAFDLLSHATSVSNIGYSVGTYDGCLNIQMFYTPDICSPPEARDIASHVLSGLRRIAGEMAR